jgi:hypothetical protein
MSAGDYVACTCFKPYASILPPPPCPTHGPRMHYQLEAAPYVPYPNDAMHALMKRVEELERRLRDAEGEGEIKAGGTD